MAKDRFLHDASTVGNGIPVAPVPGASSSGGGADAPGSALGGADVHSEMFRSLADQSLEFIGMSDLALRPFYVNAAGIRMVGLDSLEEACAVKVQDFFFPEDQRYITEEFLPRVLREGRGEVEIRFRHFKTGAALWMIYNVFHVRDARGQVSGYATVSRNITERKQTEQALRESEEKHRLLFDTMVEGFGLNEIILDAEGKPCDWRFLELNAAWEQQTGLARTDVVGKTMRQVWPDLDACWLEKFAKVALSGEPLRSEGYNPHLQGWYEVLAYQTKPNQFAVVFADITERKRAEEALRQSEEQFRLLYEKAPLGIARIDSRTGRFLLINAKYCDILQRTEADALRLDFQTVTHPDDVALDLQNMQRLREGLCRSFQMDKRYLRPDGSIVWVNLTVVPEWAEGQPASAHIAMVTDITDRKRAEEALEDSEKLYRAIGESIDYGIWICDAQGRNIYVSDSFLKLTGITQEQCSEFGWGDILHPDDTAATVEAWKQCVQSGGPWYREHRYRGADGQWHPVLACGVAVRNERGEITRWAGINLDISRLKQTEVDLRKARDELAESNANLEQLVAERTAKLQELVGELEHFSYTITHDLKAPLRAMRGFAEIASEICGSTEARPFLEKISVSAERMDRLISDALNYSRSVRQELPLEDVDVGALLRGMLDSYPELQPDKARIVVEGSLPVVLGNQAALTQCFSNLLGNAVKFVTPGEKPDVRVWATEVSAHGRQSEWVRIWVEDKGIGISKQMLPRVFEMFSRGSKDYEGTGIGLALVRKVVQRMGGKVGVESEEGNGSRFWIELGRGEARAALAQPAAHQSLASAGEGIVLYVEDEENDALFMERAFAEKGLGEKLRLVATGRAAINYLSGSGEFADRAKYPLPSVVLLDLNLPQVSGFGVLEWVRNHPDYARLPVVVFSSSTREDDRTKARELGANDFVAKPNSGLEFGKVVEELRRKWIGGKLKAR